MLRILSASDIGKLLRKRQARLDEAIETVQPILEAVRKRGDRAVLQYARKLDGFQGTSPAVSAEQLEAAADSLTPGFRAAVESATRNIREFAEFQLPKTIIQDFPGGRRLGQVVRPLDTVACYIPAGRYPLPSTLLMTAIPAQVAGVPNICVTAPKSVPEILGTAHLLGLRQAFLLGGAHAIAAFAYGTETVPKADRIVGPGNIYVAAAKKLLAGEVGIDFVAGPTEILIIARDGNPAWIAADLLAQAEHDTDASAILLTTSRKLARDVAGEVDRQLKGLPTATVARQSIKRNSAAVVVGSIEEAVALSNRIAPEHLSLHEEQLLDRVTHAGSIFLGAMSPEAAGDYASGPNHVLPTSGVARLRGGLSVLDYVKLITIQQLSRQGLADLEPAITTLARAEGLEAHARSVEVRLQ